MAGMGLEAIVHEYELRCGVERAFGVFARAGEWWHPDYTPDAGTFEDLTIEPGVGGRVFLTHKGMGEFDIGRVTVWEPPGRLVYTSTLAQVPDHPSEISVSFTAAGEGCRFHFEHGGWNEGNAPDRASSPSGP
jgi:hypothetical protein